MPPFATRLLDWAAQHGRHDLPWQHTHDPYRIWLSEVMLQQTQVATVRDYYARFVERYPDVAALAAASLDDVLALWSGLGYYSRARNLHHCAQAIVREHGGAFPRDAATLATLPGIGRSTAAAIAALAYGERVAILDGNVKRVMTRWLGYAEDLARQAHERELWQLATDQLPQQPAEMARYTQAVMDLGATLCTPRAPGCASCPVAADCVAHAEGEPEAYPVKTRSLRRTQRETVWLLLQRGPAVWLVRRPPTGIWGGLWSLPEYDSFDALAEATRGWPGQGLTLPSIDHALTHFDWRLHPRRWTLPIDAAIAPPQADAGRWIAHRDALALGLAAPLRKLLVAHHALAA